MNWLNKKAWRIFAGVAILALAIAVVLMLSGSLIPVKMCTLIGCSGGLDVKLDGLPPSTPYEISISSDQTGIYTLTCGSPTPDEAEQAFVKVCTSSGAYFSLPQDQRAPKEVTVTVTVNGKQVSQKFTPEYTEFQPNGDDCPPVCYNATLTMHLAP